MTSGNYDAHSLRTKVVNRALMSVDMDIFERIRNDIDLNYGKLMRIEYLRKWIRERFPEYIEKFGNKIEPFILQVLAGIKKFCPSLEKDCDEVLEELGLSLDVIRVKVLDSISEKKLDGCFLRAQGREYNFDGECEVRVRTPTTIEVGREGYENLKVEITKPEDIVIKLLPCKVDAVVKVEDKFGSLSNVLVKVSPVSFSGQAEEFLTDQNGSFALKLFNNQQYSFEVFIGNTLIHRETVHVTREKYYINLQVKNVFYRLKILFKKKTGTRGFEVLQEAFNVVIYDEEGNLLGRGFNCDIIPLTRPVKLGETVDVRAYPLDKGGKYIPHLYDLLKMFMENRKKRMIQINDQELTLEIDAKEIEMKELTLKFRDTKSYESLRKNVPIFEVELGGRAPKTSEVSFGEYLGWDDGDKVKAIFGGGNEEKRLYEHQYKALHELENSSGKKKCVIVSSGMASGKTEIAVLYLLKAYKEDPNFGYAVIVYPTRELLRDQYSRWKRYFDSAYDLGYLSSPIEVAMYYGEIAKRREGSKELGKIKKKCCIVLTTASTFCSQIFLRILKKPPRFVVIDEVHFYRSFDLTLLMEFLHFAMNRFGGFEKLMIFSATIGGANEFRKMVNDALNVDSCLILGESVRGRKTVYIIDLSKLKERDQEILVDEVLKEYYEKSKDKTIIFARNRTEAEGYYYRKLPDWKKDLFEWRTKAVIHIGDMSMFEREAATEKFRIGRCNWMITVKTLEVGINIGDVSRVIHLGLPPSMSEFMQREGRSGRQGQESESIIFARTKGELEKAQKWVEELRKGSSELLCKVIFNPNSLLAEKIQIERRISKKWPDKVKIGNLNIKCKVFGGFRFKLILPVELKGGKGEVYTRDVIFRYLPYSIRRRHGKMLYVKEIKIDNARRDVILDYVERNHKIQVLVNRSDFYATISRVETIVEEMSRLSASDLATVKIKFKPLCVNYIGRSKQKVSKDGEIIEVPRYYIIESFPIAEEDMEKLGKLSEDFTRGFVIEFKIPKDILSDIVKWVIERRELDLREIREKKEDLEEREKKLQEAVWKIIEEVLWRIEDCIHLALHAFINAIVQSENIHPDEIEHYVCVGISEDEAFRAEMMTQFAGYWGIDDKVRMVEELSPKLSIKIVIGNKSDILRDIIWHEKEESLNEYLEEIRKADSETILPLLELHNCFVMPEETLSFFKDFNRVKSIICNLVDKIFGEVKKYADNFTVYRRSFLGFR